MSFSLLIGLFFGAMVGCFSGLQIGLSTGFFIFAFGGLWQEGPSGHVSFWSWKSSKKFSIFLILDHDSDDSLSIPLNLIAGLIIGLGITSATQMWLALFGLLPGLLSVALLGQTYYTGRNPFTIKLDTSRKRWFFGLAKYIRCFTLRVWCWLFKHLPWDIDAFLDTATERILMHKIGNGYIFVHLLLRTYFAFQDEPPLTEKPVSEE